MDRRTSQLSLHWTSLSLASSLLALSACSTDPAHAAANANSSRFETLELRHQGTTSQVTFAEIADALGYLAPIRLKYVGNTISGPQDIQSVATGDVDFGAAFNGAIVNLAAAGAPLQAVVALSFIDEVNWSGFYVLDETPIRTARDFIGKKVGMNTVGAHHEFMLREWLARGGLTPAEIKQVTLVVLPPVNTEQALRQKQIDVAALGSILRDKAVERGGIHPVFRDFDLYGRMTSASYAMSKSFLREHPKSAAKFVEGVGKAIEWTRQTPVPEVQARLEQIVKKRNRNEDASLLRYWRPSSATLPAGLLADEQFQIWIDWLVRGKQLERGQVKASDVYTNRFNPWRKGNP
jgi:ABC-type nitrate/sulfonate/bicarbonate transport system substrate-binding protein